MPLLAYGSNIVYLMYQRRGEKDRRTLQVWETARPAPLMSNTCRIRGGVSIRVVSDF